MTAPNKVEHAVRRIAFTFPDVAEGIVCNRVAFEAGKKRFLFVEAAEGSCLVLLKLGDSLAEASKLAAAWPACYKVGTTNWVTAIYKPGQLPPPGLLERWIEESYRLLIPKKLFRQLKDNCVATAAPPSAAKSQRNNQPAAKKSKPKKKIPSR